MHALLLIKALMRLTRFLLCLMLFSVWSSAYSTGAYQVDIIVFAYTQDSDEQQTDTASVLIPTQSSIAIPLKAPQSNGQAQSYQLLTRTSTPLQRDWNRLLQQPQIHALFHYTWLQPSNNQRPVRISTQLTNGWQAEGTLRVRKSNYYLFDTQLYLSPPNRRQHPFVLTQTQRLKPSTTYYLDHPNVGMLIRIN
jgi:hypothetical protein